MGVIVRLLLTLLLILVSVGGFLTLRQLHMRRASRAGRRMAGAGDRPSLLYFRSDSCAPCVTQARYLQQVEQSFNGRLAVRKIDADVQAEQAARFGVFTLPTTLVIDRRGEVRYANYGLTAADRLVRQVEKVV